MRRPKRQEMNWTRSRTVISEMRAVHGGLLPRPLAINSCSSSWRVILSRYRRQLADFGDLHPGDGTMLIDDA
jgi:hypothetical protein